MTEFCRFNNLPFLYQMNIVGNRIMQWAKPVTVGFPGTINTSLAFISRLLMIQPAINFAKCFFRSFAGILSAPLRGLTGSNAAWRDGGVPSDAFPSAVLRWRVIFICCNPLSSISRNACVGQLSIQACVPELRWLQRSHFCAIVSAISMTPKGQAIAHLLQPIHFCSSSCTLSG